MFSNPVKNIRINVYTFGCAKNTFDSELLLGQFKSNKISVVHEAELDPSDVVIVNTCGFVNDAKQESIDSILEFVEAKNQNQIKSLYVIGCLSERYKEYLEMEIPEVDSYFGVFKMEQIVQKLGASYRKEILGERYLTTPSHYAYLKISDGCNQKCSFCAIPGIKGEHTSVAYEELVNKAKALVNQGVKEIILIAQDTTYYGLDLYNKRRLAELLTDISEIEGLEWLRLQYTFPTHFPMDALDVMASSHKICNYLDIPLQHISDHLLRKMKRGITKEKTIQLLKTIRAKIPNIAIRTTLMVGHPGESNEDFDELCEFVREMKFDRLGIFTYSHEEDTVSYKYKDDIPEVVKDERASQLMSLQRDISFRKNQKLMGSEIRVLIDKMEGDYFVGRTEFDSPEVDNEVLIDSRESLEIGNFYTVRVTSATDYDLIATVKQLN